MWTKTQDGSVIDQNGKVIYFSTERFVNDICLGDCCFVCGAEPDSKPFNDEHVLPYWILRKYNLFLKTITLPNLTTYRYDQYTTPCCVECNTLMGKVVEEPISEVVRAGSDAINDFACQGNLLKLYVWMSLIFLKTHLKDRKLRTHLDRRKGDEKIGDTYVWEDLHHIHCVVRSFYTGCSVDEEAIGSFLTLPSSAQGRENAFDFWDLYHPQTMLLELDGLALYAVMNDSGGAMSYFHKLLPRITGPVSGLQTREVMVELALLNLHMEERPTFKTEYNLAKEECRIVAERPQLSVSEIDNQVRGELLHSAISHALSSIKAEGKTEDEILSDIKAGQFTFLFDSNGDFIPKGWTSS